MVVNDGDDPPPPDDDGSNVMVQVSPGGSSAVVAFGNPGDQSELNADTTEKLNENNNQDEGRKKREELLEEEAIKKGRLNAMGELVKSAEPYNFWNDMETTPPMYMRRVVGVFFKSNSWTPPSDDDIENLLKVDLALDDPSEKITSMGINGKRATLKRK